MGKEVVALLSGVASIVGAVLAGGKEADSVGVVMEDEGSGAGVVTVAAVVSVAAAAASSVSSGIMRELAYSTAGSAAGSFSGGGVGSEGCGCFGSSEVSEGAARRLLKDTGKPVLTELDWGTEKAGFGIESGGLNKLLDVAPLDKSVPVASSADF